MVTICTGEHVKNACAQQNYRSRLTLFYSLQYCVLDYYKENKKKQIKILYMKF